MKKMGLALYIINKKLFFQPTYWILLLLALMSAFFIKSVPKEKMGYSIVFCLPREEQDLKERLRKKLEAKDSLFYYETADSKKEALLKVRRKKADEAWIIADDWREKIKDFAQGKRLKGAVAEIYLDREDTISRYSRELLYGFFYKEISYAIYERWLEEKLTAFSKEEARETYASVFTDENLFSMKQIGKEGQEILLKKENILLNPIRGIFAVLLLLTAFLSLFQIEEEKNVWLWTRIGKEWFFPYLYLFIPVFYMGLVSLFSYFYLGIGQDFTKEAISMGLFQAACIFAAFFLRDLLAGKKIWKLLLLPMLLLSIIFSPVFFEIKGYRAVKLLLPLYHYLQVFASPKALLKLAVYTGLVFLLSIAARSLRTIRESLQGDF